MTFSAATLAVFSNLIADHPLFLVGLLLLAGYSAGKLARAARLPEISGFIAAGLLVGMLTPRGVSPEMNAMLHVLTEVAISFLALSIGGEFSGRKLRRIGRDITLITAVHLAGTFLTVLFGSMALNSLFPSFNIGYPYAILLAVIACAASPAIIAAEVHHMRAHGRFIDYLFGVLALGDAVAMIMFGLAFTFVTNILGASDSYLLLRQSLVEIALSVAAGVVFAAPVTLLARNVRNPSELLIITIGFVFVATGAALAMHLSPLLLNMAMGAALVNYSSANQRVLRAIEPLTPPIYALFFVIAGLEIKPSIFLSGAGMAVALCYIVLRGAAKFWSAAAGCRLCATGPSIERNLGLCLLSKGGIALGFVLLIQTSPALESLRADEVVYSHLTGLVNVVLISIFINELASPLFLRYAVARGNEMDHR